MTDELRMAPNLGLQVGPMPNNEFKQENVDNGLTMMGADRRARQSMTEGAAAMGKTKFTIDVMNNTAKWEGPAEVARSFVESKKKVDQYQQLYDNLIAQNLKQQESFQKRPWANTLAELAASFARNDPNPYTRAIGQAATRLNPSLQELRREETDLLKQAEGFGARREAIDAGLLRTMEVADQRRDMNFNRGWAAMEQAAKNGLDDPAALEAIGKKYGMDKEAIAGFVKQGENARKMKEATLQFQKDKTKRDQDIKEAHNQVQEQLSKSRQALLREQFTYRQAVGDGTRVNVPQMLSIKARLIHELNAMDAGAAKTLAGFDAREAEIQTKYLGNKALDADGSFGKMIMSELAVGQEKLRSGQQSVAAHKDEIRAMIAQIDGTIAGTKMQAQQGEQPAAAKPTPVKTGELDADDKKALDSGKQMQDPSTGIYYKKVGNEILQSPVPFSEDYRVGPDEKSKPAGVIEGTKKSLGQMFRRGM